MIIGTNRRPILFMEKKSELLDSDVYLKVINNGLWVGVFYGNEFQFAFPFALISQLGDKESTHRDDPIPPSDFLY